MRIPLLALILYPLTLQAASDVRDSSDNELLQRFPRSYIVQYDQ